MKTYYTHELMKLSLKTIITLRIHRFFIKLIQCLHLDYSRNSLKNIHGGVIFSSLMANVKEKKDSKQSLI